MIPAAIIGGGASLLGGLVQQIGQGNSIQQQESFQTQMSDTAYQRATADMTKAGLNPAMMYGSGGAESSPSGASMTPPNVIGDAGQSALQGLQMSKAMQVSDSQIAQNLANAAYTTAKIPGEKFEGKLADSGSHLMDVAGSFLQGMFGGKLAPSGAASKTDRNLGSYDNMIQSLQSKAPVSGPGSYGPGAPYNGISSNPIDSQF